MYVFDNLKNCLLTLLFLLYLLIPGYSVALSITPDPSLDGSIFNAVNQTITSQPSAEGKSITVYDNSKSIIVHIPNLPANAKPLELALIPAGSFMMGSPANEKDREPNEIQHQVKLTQAFYIGKYEVTQAHWRAIMGSNPSYYKGDNLPVDDVSWHDCQLFIQRLNQLGQGQFRLPTEAEWEYACRAGTTTRYYWGDDLNYSQIGQYAWYFGYTSTQTHDVGLKLPNAWNLFDMSGNVWEWCQDWYGPNSSSPQTDPKGPNTGSGRVIRGGAGFYHCRYWRSAYRTGWKPITKDFNLGFRIVRDYAIPAYTPTQTPTSTVTPTATSTPVPTPTPTPTRPPSPLPTFVSHNFISLNNPSLEDNQLWADPPAGYQMGMIRFGEIPNGVGSDGTGMEINLTPGQGVWILSDMIIEATSLVNISCSIRASNKTPDVALIALNSPIDGQLGYTNLAGEELPIGDYRSMNLFYHPPAGKLQLAIQAVNDPFSTLSSTIWVDSLDVNPIQRGVEGTPVPLEVDGTFENGVEKLILNLNGTDGQINPFFESLSNIAIRLTIQRNNQAANIGTLVKDVYDQFPIRFLGQVSAKRDSIPGGGMMAFVMTNGYQNIGLFRYVDQIPGPENPKTEYLIIGGDFTVNNPGIPIHVVVQNGGPEADSSVVVDDLLILKSAIDSPIIPMGNADIEITPTPILPTSTPTPIPPQQTITISIPNLSAVAKPLEMVLLPAGTFLMGSNDNEQGRWDVEGPQHQVTLTKPFYMGIYEVTQAQYEAVMGNNPSYFPGIPNRPVEQVSWENCAVFCNRLSDREGLTRIYNEKTWSINWNANGYRLPTEAEWEYACRAGTTTRFYWGDDPDYSQIELHAWYEEKQTHEVGLKQPNAWGLHDMSGNVWEWCQDWYGNYTFNALIDPIGASPGLSCVLRGGGWSGDARYCRAASRFGWDPADKLYYLGFRIVRSMTEGVPPSPTPKPTPTALPKATPTSTKTPTPTQVSTLPREITINLPNLSASAKPLEMVLIPAGTFMMGSPEDEIGRYTDEGPQHQVTLTKSFYLGKYEVTQAQWQAVMGSNLSYFTGNNRPVEQVSWNDCQAFIQNLNKLGQGIFRLPTEAEWEYACRAGTTTRFYWGDDPDYSQIGQYAWYWDNSNSQTHEVGTKLPNAWGLYDMSGNVWEWCQDWYGTYPFSPQVDPAGVNSGSDRVLRGGSCFVYGRYCWSAYRGDRWPGNVDNNLGFRLSRTK